MVSNHQRTLAMAHGTSFCTWKLVPHTQPPQMASNHHKTLAMAQGTFCTWYHTHYHHQMASNHHNTLAMAHGTSFCPWYHTHYHHQMASSNSRGLWHILYLVPHITKWLQVIMAFEPPGSTPSQILVECIMYAYVCLELMIQETNNRWRVLKGN